MIFNSSVDFEASSQPKYSNNKKTAHMSRCDRILHKLEAVIINVCDDLQ